MRRPFRSIAVHAAAVATLAFCAAASAADATEPAPEPDPAPAAEAMALDLFLVRPLSLVGTVLGVGVFIVALPFNAITLNFADPARKLILEPAKYTFTRDLGDLD